MMVNQAARERFYNDPEFRAIVELLTRVAIQAVERGDGFHDQEDTGFSRWEDRHMQVLGDMIDTFGSLDQQLGKSPEICYGTVYPHYFQGTRQPKRESRIL